MLKNSDYKIAVEYGILDKINKLEKDLLAVDGVTEVEFDLSGFLDNMHEVIFLTKYSIPQDAAFYAFRRAMKLQILRVAMKHGLTRTGDRIEDYGEHLYFVLHRKEHSQEAAGFIRAEE